MAEISEIKGEHALRTWHLHRGCPGFDPLSSHTLRRFRRWACTNTCHVFAALALAWASPAHADDALILARVAVAEAGFTARADHAAIWHVLRKRSEMTGVPLARMAVAYSSPIRRGHWASHLGWRGMRPQGYPRGSWSNVRGLWAAVLGRARAFMRGEVADPCPSAVHWGDRRGDWDRATASGWRLVECRAPTLNAFWRP